MNLLDEIHKLIGELGGEYYGCRKDPDFLVLLEDGEGWIKRFREYLDLQN